MLTFRMKILAIFIKQRSGQIINFERALYSGKREVSSLFRMSYFSHEDDGVQEGILDQEEKRFVNQDLLGLLEEGRQRADLDTYKINECAGVELWEMATDWLSSEF
jgi:hypothetical protein